MELPSPILAKLAHAYCLAHILNAQINHVMKESGEKIREEIKTESGFRSIGEGTVVDASIPLMCGDVLQNIRSLLDYLVWELVLANNNQPDEGNAFPICRSLKSFKDAAKRRLHGVHPDAVVLIESLQPYHFAKESDCGVFLLDKLVNVNKHRTILISEAIV